MTIGRSMALIIIGVASIAFMIAQRHRRVSAEVYPKRQHVDSPQSAGPATSPSVTLPRDAM
jgi:hypothetical protein